MLKVIKLIAALMVVFLTAVVFNTADAQINRRKIKKNNRSMSKFKGKNNTFTAAKRYSFVGLSGSALNYFGDLAPLPRRFSTDFKFTRPSLGATYGYRFGPFYTLRGQFSYGTVAGSDFESADPLDENAKFRYIRNLQFRNRIVELSVTGVFDLFKNENTYISRMLVVPYAYIGAALFHHNPKGYVHPDSGLPEAGTWVALQPLGTEGQHSTLPGDAVNAGIEPYKRIQISIPFGIGIRYKINDYLDFSFESGFRYLFTDYIDDVSQNYVDPGVLNSDVARAMADRSQETTDAVSGEARDMETVNSTAGTSFATPGGYSAFAGYGRESLTNMRGNKNDPDIYFVTTMRVTYIMGSGFKKAKFR